MRIKRQGQSNKFVPSGFNLNLDEENCLSNAERLQEANIKLRYVEGFVKGPGENWSDKNCHAWCETKSGLIVDPYFKAKFPKEWMKIQYREDSMAFA